MLKDRLIQRARQLKSRLLVIYFVSQDLRLRWYLKLFAVLIVAYALSPLDLIPDFIPVIGLIDDLILIPLGLALIIRWAPKDVVHDAEVKSRQKLTLPANYWAAGVILVIWALAVLVIGNWVLSVTNN